MIVVGIVSRSEEKEKEEKEIEIEQRDIPRTAACGKLMIGVPYSEPNTPPFELK
jgi:hypothetical protein